jgi:hypothetical protein
LPANEIGRMKGSTIEREEEKKERGDFGNGISIEGEFAFTKAVGDFVQNVREQGKIQRELSF